MDRQGTLAFVPARYGEGTVGGAESVLSDLAHGLAGRGWEVEILTTCARNHYTWENEFDPGTEQVDDVVIRRFPAVVSTPRSERAAIGGAIEHGHPVSLRDQQRWMNDDMRVPEMYHHLVDEASRYRAIVFAPYLFWPAFACSQLVPERTILMPCLHDEPAASLELFSPIFTGVRGLWFLSEPEMALAERLHPDLAPHRIVGAGVRVPDRYDPEGFRRRHKIDGRFLLYAGRREGAKNWERLLEGFAAATIHANLPFYLVTMGTGDVRPPSSIADRVIDLGYCTNEDRDDALAAADAYLQPSQFESFSLTILEAWLAGTLVVANGQSEVVSWHIERSGAGLSYLDNAELEECLRFIAQEPAAAQKIAASGRDYVLANYRNDDVLDRVEASIADWLPARDGGS